MRKRGVAIITATSLLAASFHAFAHGGGLNRDGCHNETATGGYHCHSNSDNDLTEDDNFRKNVEGFNVIAPPLSYNHHRNNTTAEDLRDHWNDPASAQAALDLDVLPAIPAIHKASLSTLIGSADWLPDGAGTFLRNIDPQQINVIGERGGLTFGQWKGGPAGTLNIEFNLETAPDFPERAKPILERAGKAWSYRLADDFPERLLPGNRYLDPDWAGQPPERYYYPEGTTTDDLLISIVHSPLYGYFVWHMVGA